LSGRSQIFEFMRPKFRPVGNTDIACCTDSAEIKGHNSRYVNSKRFRSKEVQNQRGSEAKRFRSKEVQKQRGSEAKRFRSKEVPKQRGSEVYRKSVHCPKTFQTKFTFPQFILNRA
jgi:hypothetical protein